MSLLKSHSDFNKLVKTGDLYRDVFDRSVLPIIIHDMYFNIIDGNQKALQEFGYSRDEFLKMQIFDLHVNSELEKSLEVLEKMKTTDKTTVKTIFKRKDGAIFSAEASPCKISLEGFSFIHVHLQNITPEVGNT